MISAMKENRDALRTIYLIFSFKKLLEWHMSRSDVAITLVILNNEATLPWICLRLMIFVGHVCVTS